MLDPYNRRITYLRLSVTDRCNLRCCYCMPPGDIKYIPKGELLTFEEIEKVVTYAVSAGITKVRLTGGEPLMRNGIVSLVARLKKIQGVEELSMTTNGVLLDRFALPLSIAGLNRVNISLDTMDPVMYHKITGGGSINNVLKGIEAALAAGLTPVKLNCVVMNSAKNQDLKAVVRFSERMALEVRFIHQMDLSTGRFSQVIGGDGGKCYCCNRIRLTSYGAFRPCLFNSLEYNIRNYGIAGAMRLAVNNKPLEGVLNTTSQFFNIGG